MPYEADPAPRSQLEGRGRPSRTYLTESDPEEALVRMDAAYAEVDQGGDPILFKRVGRDKRDSYWGILLARAENEHRFEPLGVRGRIWALCLLARRAGFPHSEPGQIAVKIAESARARRPAVAKRCVDSIGLEAASRWSKHASDEIDPRCLDIALRQLVSERQKEGFPPSEIAYDLLDLVIDWCIETVRTGREFDAESLAAAARGPAGLPSELLLRMLGIVQPGRASTSRPSVPRADGDGWLSSCSVIDPSIDLGITAHPSSGKRYNPPEDRHLDDGAICDLYDALPRHPRLLVLTGQPFFGKKVRVAGLLRWIASPRDDLVLRLPRGRRRAAVSMPILALSARGIHYRELVGKVIRFLAAYSARKSGAAASATGDAGPSPLGLEEMLGDIHLRYGGLPALFVFTDVDALAAVTSRSVVRDIGIKRLIRELLGANADSRVILTTTSVALGPHGEPHAVGLPHLKEVRVTEPDVSEIQGLLPEDLRWQIPQALNYRAHRSIRGHDLIAIAALMRLNAARLYREGDAMADFIGTLSLDGDADRLAVYRRLLQTIEGSGVVHAVALVAASDDGLRDRSLLDLLLAWRSQEPTVEGFDDVAALVSAMQGFSAKAGERFLRRARMVRYDPEEYAHDERHAEDDKVWDIDAPIASMFMEALRLTKPLRFRQAYRLVAAAARRRAQIKKLNMRSPLGTRATEDASRDIQAYVSLLDSMAALPPRPTDETARPLRLSEDRVFSIDPALFDPRLALRFAVLCLLQEDIDRDHRLTMVFDEDALRLDLYLRLFQDFERARGKQGEPLGLPERIPSHLLADVFSPRELLEIMSAVALSALHAQRYEVVEGIRAMASAYVSDHGRPDMEPRLARIWCCSIDAWIMRGSAPRGKPGYAGALDAVQRFLKRLQGPDGAGSEAAPVADREPELAKADMRLMAREAEIRCLLGHREEAQALYGRIMAMESRLSRMESQHDPVVMSGRVARRYIRCILGDGAFDASDRAPAEAQSRRKELLDRVRALLDVNTSRLRRFSGADRVGVMVDLARLNAVEGKLEEAMHYANSARRRAFMGSVSHGGKLDVLAVFADVHLRLVERSIDRDASGRDPGDKALLDLAVGAASDLHAIASALECEPHVGVAACLKARAMVAGRRLESSDGGLFDPDVVANWNEAVRIATRLGDATIKAQLETLRRREPRLASRPGP